MGIRPEWSALAQEYPVSGVIAFFPVCVAEFREVGLELVCFILRHVDTGQNAPIVRTVVAVVKQADVPVRTDRVQKIEQGTRPFRELESEQAFIADAC